MSIGCGTEMNRNAKTAVQLGADLVAAAYEKQLAALKWERMILVAALDRATDLVFEDGYLETYKRSLAGKLYTVTEKLTP